MTYPQRVLLSLDQLFNTVIGGYPDETLSSRCYRRGVIAGTKRWYYAYRVVNFLFFWQEDHCKQAYGRELAGRHTARELR